MFRTSFAVAFSIALASAASAQTTADADKSIRGAAINQTITTALGTEWEISNSGGTSGTAFSGSCTGNPNSGFSIVDAATQDGDGDMYDYGWSIWVDDTIFASPAGFTVSGNTASSGPETLSGLTVSMEYLFSDVIEAGRLIATFANPTASPISVSVDVPINFGSDSSTTIITTASGDTTFTTADGWGMTWDTSSEINTSVFFGPGATVTPSAVTEQVFGCAGSQGLGATFDLTIPAGGTQALMFFMGIGEIDGTGSTDIANAQTNAQQFGSFATIDASLTGDLTQQELDQIVNWTGSGVTPPPTPGVAIPTLSTWSLLLLALLMLGLPMTLALRR
jgi:hypothetical protein